MADKHAYSVLIVGPESPGPRSRDVDTLLARIQIRRALAFQFLSFFLSGEPATIALTGQPNPAVVHGISFGISTHLAALTATAPPGWPWSTPADLWPPALSPDRSLGLGPGIEGC